MTLSVAMVIRKLAILLVGAAAKKSNSNIVTGREKCIAMVIVFFQSQLHFSLVNISFTQ